MHRFVLAAVLSLTWVPFALADELQTPRYHVAELAFRGPVQSATDTPARDVELWVKFRHEPSGAVVRMPGFWDGDDAFKVRFCPTSVGDWQVVEADSNEPALKGQRVGDTVRCTESSHPGLWIAEGRWYRRSDGSHPFVIGNTHYSFLSRRNAGGAVATNPVDDIRRQAPYFNKLRFTLVGDRYPDPEWKPFLDESGKPSDDGRFSLRPNPEWFRERVDPAIREGFAQDVICDLILCGPDTMESRITLQGNNEPWLRYVAARYGAYPHVWFCLCNEWNIKKPNYTAEQIRNAGETLRKSLPHATTPVSVHANTGNWDTALNGNWADHVIIQWKLKTIAEAADAAARNVDRGGGKPLVNDENAYEGAGDKFSEGDVVEGCFGTFLGGGYPTTGEKRGNKLGQYFWGSFDPEIHKASDNLQYLRRYVDERVAFWRMVPGNIAESRFRRAPTSFRVLADRNGDESVLGSQAAAEFLVNLPRGNWRITQVDLMSRQTTVLAEDAEGDYVLRTPDSRAVLTHFVRKQVDADAYFPPPESQGGWRKLSDAEAIRERASMDPQKLNELREWLLASDSRDFAAVVIRRGHIVLEVERNKSAVKDAQNVKSCAKAICATVLAIASEESRQGRTPRKMTFDDPAFDFIPWAQPLSDPRKAKITVRQLFNHTSGITPESTGVRNAGPWEAILGHTGDDRTAKLAFDPGTNLDYGTHPFYHAALVCETVTGQPYDRFAIAHLLQPLGIETWWFEQLDGDARHGRHPSHAIGLPARELARIAYCLLHDGQWGERRVVPEWLIHETAAPTHPIEGTKTFGRDARSFSHGWELPGLLTDERGRGIPKDARFKPGSGGQLIAFVPSLDLVIARQTGSSGAWAYEEFLRRACAAVSQSR